MNPALHNEAMQARSHDMLRTAAQQRLAAEVKAAHVQAARRARQADVASAPARRWRRLAWRLLPA